MARRSVLDELDELELLELLCRRAKDVGKLSGKDLFILYKCFGDRLTQALKAVRDGRVRLHVFKPSNRKLWTVIGKHGEYVVFPGALFCGCDNFYFETVRRLKPHLCYHLIAQRIAELLGIYEKEKHPDEEYDFFVASPMWKRNI